MTTLKVCNGWGKCTNKNGTELTVLRVNGLYNLMVHYPAEKFSFWVKENVKRISTIQKEADKNGYDVKIEVFD